LSLGNLRQRRQGLEAVFAFFREHELGDFPAALYGGRPAGTALYINST
jgi:hypothetical protein